MPGGNGPFVNCPFHMKCNAHVECQELNEKCSERNRVLCVQWMHVDEIYLYKFCGRCVPLAPKVLVHNGDQAKWNILYGDKNIEIV